MARRNKDGSPPATRKAVREHLDRIEAELEAREGVCAKCGHYHHIHLGGGPCLTQHPRPCHCKKFAHETEEMDLHPIRPPLRPGQKVPCHICGRNVAKAMADLSAPALSFVCALCELRRSTTAHEPVIGRSTHYAYYVRCSCGYRGEPTTSRERAEREAAEHAAETEEEGT